MKKNFKEIENDINTSMKNTFKVLDSDQEKKKYFASLFDRTVEEGFYKNNSPRKGEGEKPTWAPNPAYMDSLEYLCEGSLKILKDHGLKLEKTLKELFYESREYKDYTTTHRRVFFGQILSISTSKPVTMFLLSVPHSHKCFEYIREPHIYLDKFLENETD